MGKPWREMSQREKDGRGSRKWKRTRAFVLAQSDICWMCGRPGATTVDHYPIPLGQDGTNDIGNLRPAHGPKQPWGCPGNFGRKDRSVPVTPTSREW